MTTKQLYLSLSFLLLSFLFCLQAKTAPSPVKEIPPVDIQDLSKKDLEKQLGRKLKLKEKIALKIAKKQAKKLDNQGMQRNAMIKTVDGFSIVGNISHIKDDKVYLVNYDKVKAHYKKIYDEGLELKGDTVIASAKMIKKIVVSKNPTKWKKARKFRNFALGLGIVGLLLFGIGVLISNVSSVDNRTDIAFAIGGYYMVIASIFMLLVSLILLAINSTKLKIGNTFSSEQIEILQAYF